METIEISYVKMIRLDDVHVFNEFLVQAFEGNNRHRDYISKEQQTYPKYLCVIYFYILLYGIWI